jgi:hypothetical protein
VFTPVLAANDFRNRFASCVHDCRFNLATNEILPCLRFSRRPKRGMGRGDC